MDNTLTILRVSGPFREPREPVFSYDYSIQRPVWSTAYAVRVKVAIAEELEYVKAKVLGPSAGSPGQQLRVNQLLSRRIADQKFKIADAESMFSERRDVLVGPFTGPYQHFFSKLESWLAAEQAALREEIRKGVGL